MTNRLLPFALSLLLLLPACRADSTGADTRQYSCLQNDECAPGFICRAGVCQDESKPPILLGDAGTPDGGNPQKSTRLGITSPVQSVDTNLCSAAVEIETQTSAGTGTPVEAATTILLSAQPTQGVGFFSDSTCSTPITSVTVAAGSRSASFYFRGSTAQSVQITVAASGFESATQTGSLRAVLTSTAFTSGAQQLQTGACSASTVLEARDASNRPMNLPTSRTVKLEGPNLLFYADAACTNALANASFVFAAGESHHSFYFKGQSGGSAELRASVQDLATVSQTQTILPVVRASTCTMGAGLAQVTCGITPPQTDMSKTFLLFQASRNGKIPASGLVRCWLNDTSSIVCDRNSASTESFDISWKTVELRTGLRVQHLRPVPQGTSPYIRVTLNSRVTSAKSFLLVSQQVGGDQLGEDDFATVKLNSAGTQVEYQFTTNATGSWKGALQVVEMDGIQVTRGTTSLTSGPQATVSNLSAVDTTSSVLLSTHRVSNAGSAIVCDRVIRGDLVSPTGIEFYRGSGNSSTRCTTATIDEIAWERIQFGSLARVQTVQAYTNLLSNTSEPTFAARVDTTRSVVFASGQSLNGQSEGETYSDSGAEFGEPLATFAFQSPTQLSLYRDGGSFAKWTAYVVQFEP